MFELKQASVKDAEAIKVFKDIVLHESKFMNPITLEEITKLIKKYTSGNNKYYLAMAGDKVLGQAILEVQKGFVAYITHFAVLKELYGTGLATKLMLQTIADSKLAGVKNIELVVHEDNIRARHFYTKYNFTYNRTHKLDTSYDVFKLKLNIDFERNHQTASILNKW